MIQETEDPLTEEFIRMIVREAFWDMDMYHREDGIWIVDQGNFIQGRYFSQRYSVQGEEGTKISFTLDKVTRERTHGSIQVNDHFKRHGFGTQMMTAVETICRNVGTPKIRTTAHSPGSEGFWCALGYTLVNGEYEKQLQ